MEWLRIDVLVEIDLWLKGVGLGLWSVVVEVIGLRGVELFGGRIVIFQWHLG